MRLTKSYIILVFLLIFALKSEASEDKKPPPVGNFILPNSQHPAPLVSFGQHIISKNEIQLFLFADNYVGINSHYIDLVPGFLYGITDNFSALFDIPFAASYKAGNTYSAGFKDIPVQFEYAFYNMSTSDYVNQATIVGSINFPTGSINKQPPTGAGASSFFLGTTFNRTYVNWFFFASPGVLLTIAKNGTKSGNSYLYQAGLGRNISDRKGWLLAWMIEINGTYTVQNRIKGIINSNSGGNQIFVTPSLWASTKKLILQIGLGFPATQHLYGNQTRDTYLLVANMGWSIY